MSDQAVRELLAKMLSWDDAHAGFDAAVDGIPEEFRGKRAGAHSPWELVEHLRLAQHDILDFSRNKDYEEMDWPKDYWPKSPAPSSTAEWNNSIDAFRKDREALRELALDSSIDVTAAKPRSAVSRRTLAGIARSAAASPRQLAQAKEADALSRSPAG